MPEINDNQYRQAERLLAELRDKYQAGTSINALAKEYGLRREAIATVLTVAGVVPSTEGRDRVLTYVREHGGVSVDDIARDLQLPKSTISRHLRGAPEQALVVSRKKTDYDTYSEDVKCEALREAWDLLDEAQQSRGLSRVKYDKLVGQRKDRPSAVTFVREYGSWSGACRAAGISASAARRANYEQRFSDDDIIVGIGRFIAETGRTSFHEYAKWAKHNSAASGPLVIVRMGSWTSARTLVIERAADRSSREQPTTA